MIVRELFESARRSVIVGGYAFDKPEILKPLHAKMIEHGVTVQLFLDIKGEAASVQSADAFATNVIDKFFRDVWTFGAPKPDVYYDPRTAVRGPPADRGGSRWRTTAPVPAPCFASRAER